MPTGLSETNEQFIRDMIQKAIEEDRAKRPEGSPPSIPDINEAIKQGIAQGIEAVGHELKKGILPTPLDVEAKANIDEGLKSQMEKFHAEPHYWVTFHYMGEDDNIDVETVQPAGVRYYCRKEEPVLLPQSALNALKLAVVVGNDYQNPIKDDQGRTIGYKKLRRPRFNYTTEGQVSPEEAAAWRARNEKVLLEMEGQSLYRDDDMDA